MSSRSLAFLSLLVSVAAFAATVVLRDHRGTDILLDAGVYNVPFAVSIVVLLARARADAEQRTTFLLFALGIALFTAGNLISTIVWNDDPNPPYPSIADACWLAWYGLAFAGMIRMLRLRVPRMRLALVLDGLIVGLTVSSFVSAFVFADVLRSAGGDLAQVVTNLAYPVADLVLLAVLAGTAVFAGSRIDRGMLTLAAGILVFVVADSLFLLEDAGGTYVEGGPLDILWPAGVALIAASSLLPAQQRAGARVNPRFRFLIPIPAGLGAWAIVMGNAFGRLPRTAVAFAAFALLAVLARALVAALEHGELSRTSELALIDDLTSLHNRRGFWEHLRALPVDAPCALLMLDFDHFKEINDRHGHVAGDEVLREASRRLVDVVGDRARVSRVGGEELAVVIVGIDGEGALRELAEDLRRAIADAPVNTARVQIAVTISIGGAIGPPGDRLIDAADNALYSAKRLGRNRTIIGSLHALGQIGAPWADLGSLGESLGIHLFAGLQHADGRFEPTFISDAFTERLGVDSWGDLPEETWFGRIVPEDRDRYERELSWDVISHHPTARCAYRMRGHDGKVLEMVEELIVRSREPDGSLRIEGIVTDVSERVWAERRLREVGSSMGLHLYEGVARRNDAWSDNLAPGADVALAGGTLPAASDVYGAWRSRVHPDDLEEYDRVLTFDRIETQEAIGLVYRMVGYDGVTRSLREMIFPRERLDANSIRFEGVIQDVTSAQASLIDLQLLGRFGEQLAMVSYEGLIAADGSFHEHVTRGSVEQITGSRPRSGEETEEHWIRHVHPDDRAAYLEWSADATNDETSLAYRVLQGGGAIRMVVEWNWVGPTNVDGSHQSAGFVLDLTDRMQQLGELASRDAADDRRAA